MISRDRALFEIKSHGLDYEENLKEFFEELGDVKTLFSSSGSRLARLLSPCPSRLYADAAWPDARKPLVVS